MMNSEINTMELGNSVGGASICHKQPVFATKKVALRDVQNNNINLTCQESLLPVMGRPHLDATKMCGTKRLAPEHDSSHMCPPLLSNNGANVHFNYARRKYELEGNRGRSQGNVERFTGCPQSANFPHLQHEMTSKQTQIKGKNVNHSPLLAPNHTVSRIPVREPKAEVPQFKQSIDEQMTERFIRLQNFIKHCDMSNQRENIQKLLHLSPSELSRHAIELEKRAIQLTIEEGKEIQRVQALNILGKPASTSNTKQTTQLIQPKK